MDVQTLFVRDILVGERQRQADAKKVGELAQSIEHVGLLQPIGVIEDCSQEEQHYRLVFGLHRLHAMLLLERTEIAAYVLPPDLEPEAYLLIELQENSTRNDLTGPQRKAFAAEIGRLLAILSEDGHLANGQKNWLEEMANTSAVPYRTMRNWWQTFCEETGLHFTPRQALEPHRQRFFDWLEAQQQQAEAERQRKAQEAAEAERIQYLTELRQEIIEAIARYGWDDVYELVIARLLANAEHWPTSPAQGEPHA